MAHQWRFFRSGGFDQVKLDKITDWQQLDQLDPKLWAALSCPVKGLEFDSRTLQYLDTDGDGRVRIDEVKAAVRWALTMLKNPEVLLSGDALPLAAINDQHDAGKTLLASAKRLLTNLGQGDANALAVSHTADLASVFPPGQFNGDGIITEALASNDALKQLISTAITCGFSQTDRSGDAGIGQEQLDSFLLQAQQRCDWLAAGNAFTQLFDGNIAEVAALVTQLEPKVADYFTRCQLAAYDETAAPLLNASAEHYQQLAQSLLSLQNSDSSQLPLAKVSSNLQLPLNQGVHPHWAQPLQRLQQLANWHEQSHLSLTQWQDLQSQLSNYRDWLAAEPQGVISEQAPQVLQACLSATVIGDAQALIADDLAAAAEAEAILDVDKLLRYQRYLRDLLQNFVNFDRFYSLEQPAVFQNGRLYIDGRSCDLCMEVNDAGKHAKLAALSGTYLLYVDCVRQQSGQKKTIVAAVTAGDAGNLMAGRNGVYYDRAGQDWDATVASIVQNPISISEAFYTPYQRIGCLVSDQIQKFAAAKDKEIESKSAAGVDDAAKLAQTAAKPAAPFDVAKFAGIFAAIGLAIGAIGTAIASVVTGFMGLSWWQMPLALLGLVLFISGPSMLIAWFKLRTRNLAPLLDANGWAVNTNAKLSLPFGTRLTAVATIPAGSSRSMQDPYAPSSKLGPVLFVLFLVGLAVAYFQGWLDAFFTN